MNVGSLIGLLKNFPAGMEVKVLNDGVEELPFDQPTITRANPLTPHEFVAINVLVEE